MSNNKASQDTPLLSTSPPPKASRFRLYYELNRLHKFPAGVILIFWPCAWALTMASYRTSRPLADFLFDLAIYGLASTLVHSAACVINDMCDRDLDRQVERTKNRPLACGAISMTGATICLLLEVSVCLMILACTGSLFVSSVGLFGIFPLHGLYPTMKRYTYWPQAWLGLAMNWGFVLVWISLVEREDYMIPGVFFLGTICWTIVYDTIYGCQDLLDDAKAGIKSTSLLFGNYVQSILTVFAGAFVLAMSYAGYLNHQGLPYYIVSIGGTSLHLAWQLITLKPHEPADCWKKFQSNGTLGLIAWSGMVLDYVTALP